MFLETSKDVLYLVIAFCVLWVTVFMCWMFYYVTKILRNTNEIAEEFRMKLHSLSEAINHVRDRVEQMSSLMTLLTGGFEGLVKRTISKKIKKTTDKGADALEKSAKQAVAKAKDAINKAMKKSTKKIKKKK
ncbi:MAG: hypothetical protein ABIH87_01175 [bacterium]